MSFHTLSQANRAYQQSLSSCYAFAFDGATLGVHVQTYVILNKWQSQLFTPQHALEHKTVCQTTELMTQYSQCCNVVSSLVKRPEYM